MMPRIFPLSCPAPVVDKTTKGGVRQFGMMILLCIVMDGYELLPRCMPVKKMLRFVAATPANVVRHGYPRCVPARRKRRAGPQRGYTGVLIVRRRVLKHGPNTAWRKWPSGVPRNKNRTETGEPFGGKNDPF
jgi:hypothetical protein